MFSITNEYGEVVRSKHFLLMSATALLVTLMASAYTYTFFFLFPDIL